MKLPLGDARLDRHIGEFFAEIHDPIQPAKIEQDAGSGHGNARSIAPILTCTYRVERDSKLVGNAQTCLDLSYIGRT